MSYAIDDEFAFKQETLLAKRLESSFSTNENISFDQLSNIMDDLNRIKQENSTLNEKNTNLKEENKKAKTILKDLIQQLNTLQSYLLSDRVFNQDLRNKQEETINKLEKYCSFLNDKTKELEVENSVLKSFKDEIPSREKPSDKVDKIIDNQEASTIETVKLKKKKKGAKKFNFPNKSVDFLVQNYNQNKFPDSTEIKAIANETNLTSQQVNKWFRDRRHKLEDTKVFLLTIYYF